MEAGVEQDAEKSVHGLFQPLSAEVNSAPLPESFGFFKASVIPPAPRAPVATDRGA